MCQGTAEAEDIATGSSELLDVGSCTDTEQDFWDSLSDIADINFLKKPNTLMTSHKPTPPKSGESCPGPVNICATSDGSRCIAELSVGAGGHQYTATCKLSHFSTDRKRLGEVLFAGEDPLYQAKNSALSLNGTPQAMSMIPAVCPCNCTYVSNACCVAPSGIVYENTKLKLGELRPEQCLEGLIKSS